MRAQYSHSILEFWWPPRRPVQSVFRLMLKDVIWGFKRLFPTVHCKGII